MTRLLRVLLLVLLAGAALAAGDPPFPFPDGTLTLGRFLSLVSSREALNVTLVVRDSVPREKTLELSLRDLSCRQALDLVVAAEELTLTELRPGVLVVSRGPERAAGGAVTHRQFVLTHTTAERVIALLRAQPRLAEGVDASGLTVGNDPRTLIAVGPAESLAKLSSAMEMLDTVPVRPTPVPTAPPKDDEATESVTVGVATVGSSYERARTSGVGLDGRVAYEGSSTTSSERGAIWVTTLSGSPARIALQQVFNVALTQSVSGPSGTQVTQAGTEVPVGLSLEVTPRITGDAVQVAVRIVDSVATRVSDIGVDRSERAVLTTVRVPRGGSAVIGGIESALAESSRPDALGLLNAVRARRQSLTLNLFVR